MRKSRIDCLLVHVPNTMPGGGLSVMSISMGLFALADILNRNGFAARIIHLGLGRINNQAAVLEEYVNNNDIPLIGFSLHWHLQSYDTMREIKRIKSVKPEAKIVLGGFTAGFFADEIMKDFSCVDFIIKGDAEVPLLELVRSLSKARTTFASIPNLVWRRGGEIISNDITYLADNSSLERLNFTNFNLLEDFAVYKKIGLTVASYSLKDELFSSYKKMFPVCVGRGCSVNCSFCGGSKLSQKVMCNRHGIVFRSPGAVLESVKTALSAGYDGIYLDFDPWPRRTYFKKLFSLIRKSGINTALEFTCWSLPDEDFVNDLKKTFRENVSLLISPETGSDRLRKLNKGRFFTNKELIASLSLLKRKKIRADIYFSYPLPFTAGKDIKQENGLIKLLSGEFSDFHRIIRPALSFDPASPMFIDPDKYQIKKQVKGFSDYCAGLKGIGYSLAGYNHRDYKSMFRRHENACIAGCRLLPEAKECRELKNFKQAVKLAEEALRLNPGDIEIYSLLGACYEETARDRDALKIYSKALKICPRAEGIYLSLIKLYMKLKMYPMAVKAIIKIGKISREKDAGLYLLLGFCYAGLRQYKNAVAAFRKAEKINPNTADISFHITKCYLRMKKKASAAKEISRGYYKLKNTVSAYDNALVD